MNGKALILTDGKAGLVRFAKPSPIKYSAKFGSPSRSESSEADVTP